MRKLTGSTFANVIVVVAIAIIPLLYAGLLTSAYQNPTNRLDTMTAAVVDLDTPADVTLATGETRHFALGDELADRLTDPQEGQDVGFTWVRMDSEDEARAAMTSEDIRAMLVIPADFTQATTRVAAGDPQDAAQQTLSLETDDGVNYLAGTMAKTVASEMENVMTARGVDEYVDNIVMSLGTIRDGMDDAQSGASALAEGADDLQSGLSSLEDGASTARSGASQLADGAGQVASGAQSAASGADALSSGVAALSQGASTLDSGVSRYTAGVDQAASGARQIASGAEGLTTLADGVGTYTAGVDQLRATVVAGTSQTPSLVSGASALSTGLAQLVGDGSEANPGLTALANGLGTASDTGDLKEPSHNDTLVKGVDAYTRGVDSLSGQLNDPAATQKLQELTGGAQSLSSGVAEYTKSIKQIQQLCAGTHGASDPVCAALAQATQQNETLTNGASQVDSGVTTLAGQVGEAADGAKALSDQSDTLRSKTQSAATGAQTALAGAQKLAAGASTLQAGIGQATDAYNPATGSGRSLAGVLNTLSSQSQTLRAGASSSTQLIGATSQLSSGLTTLTQNSSALASGARQLAEGASTASSGAGTLTVGLKDLADGSATLADSTSALADGLATLDKGARTASDGSSALATGAAKLTEGLSDGVDRIPAYTDADAGHIADVISTPVAVDAVRDHAVANNGAGFTPMFMSLALWVGGIAIFLVLPALDRRPGPTEKWWHAALRPATTATVLSVAQAVLMMTIVNWTIGLSADNVGGLVLLAIAASLTFVAVNQAAVATMAYRGRFVSIILLSLQITSMGATFPVETAPRFFQWIHPFLPMSYTQLAFRDMIAGAGADHAVRNCLAILAVWFVAAVACTFLGAYFRGGRRPLPRDNALLQDQLAADAEQRAAQARVELERARPSFGESATAGALGDAGSGPGDASGAPAAR
jgi:putative membrane protein